MTEVMSWNGVLAADRARSILHTLVDKVYYDIRQRERTYVDRAYERDKVGKASFYEALTSLKLIRCVRQHCSGWGIALPCAQVVVDADGVIRRGKLELSDIPSDEMRLPSSLFDALAEKDSIQGWMDAMEDFMEERVRQVQAERGRLADERDEASALATEQRRVQYFRLKAEFEPAAAA